MNSYRQLAEKVVSQLEPGSNWEELLCFRIFRAAATFGGGETAPFGGDGAAMDAIGGIDLDDFFAVDLFPFVDIRGAHVNPGVTDLF